MALLYLFFSKIANLILLYLPPFVTKSHGPMVMISGNTNSAL